MRSTRLRAPRATSRFCWSSTSSPSWSRSSLSCPACCARSGTGFAHAASWESCSVARRFAQCRQRRRNVPRSTGESIFRW